MNLLYNSTLMLYSQRIMIVKSVGVWQTSQVYLGHSLCHYCWRKTSNETTRGNVVNITFLQCYVFCYFFLTKILVIYKNNIIKIMVRSLGRSMYSANEFHFQFLKTFILTFVYKKMQAS